MTKKRIFSLATILFVFVFFMVCVFGVAACGGSDENDNDDYDEDAANRFIGTWYGSVSLTVLGSSAATTDIEIIVDEDSFTMIVSNFKTRVGFSRNEDFVVYDSANWYYSAKDETYYVKVDSKGNTIPITIEEDASGEDVLCLSFDLVIFEFDATITDQKIGRKAATVESVAINLSADSVDVGDVIVATADVAMDQNDAAYTGKYTWKSSDEGILDVEEDGAAATVTGLSVGTATISVTLDDGSSATSSGITVSTPHVIAVSFSESELLVDADATNIETPELVVTMSSGEYAGSVTYSTTDTDIINVDASTGAVTLADGAPSGTATVTATLDEAGEDGVFWTASYTIMVKATITVSDPFIGTWSSNIEFVALGSTCTADITITVTSEDFSMNISNFSGTIMGIPINLSGSLYTVESAAWYKIGTDDDCTYYLLYNDGTTIPVTITADENGATYFDFSFTISIDIVIMTVTATATNQKLYKVTSSSSEEFELSE